LLSCEVAAFTGGTLPIYGMTGTRKLEPGDHGPVADAIDRLNNPGVLVVGGCVGADTYAAQVAWQRGMWVHVVLPANSKLIDPQWYRYANSFEQMPDGSDYRARNQRIVDLATAAMVAFPDRAEQHGSQRRSGTWMTVRLSRKAGLPVYITVLHPN